MQIASITTVRRVCVTRRLLAAATIVVSLSLSLIVSLKPWVSAGEPVSIAVIYPPWRDQATNILSVADVGPVMGVGAMPFVVFTRTTDARQHAALRAGGAWLVADAAAFRWCSPRTGNIGT